MVVHKLNVGRPLTGPDKAKTKLVVHPDRMLALAVSQQRFQAIAWWEPQIVQSLGRIKHRQLTLHDALKIDRKALCGTSSLKERHAARILERYDRHATPSPNSLVSHDDTNGNLNG
jgi:hypothetical protein